MHCDAASHHTDPFMTQVYFRCNTLFSSHLRGHIIRNNPSKRGYDGLNWNERLLIWCHFANYLAQFSTRYEDV